MESDLWDVLENVDHPRVMVLGDMCLERWAWGEMAPHAAANTLRRDISRRTKSFSETLAPRR